VQGKGKLHGKDEWKVSEGERNAIVDVEEGC
jgi:hypothetical protein